MGREGEPRYVKRRSVLQAAGIIAAGYGLNAWMQEPEPVDKRVVSYLKDNLYEMRQPQVGINTEGLPVNCILPNGKEISFNIRRAAQIREKAKRTGEPEVVSVVRYPDPSTTWLPFDFEPSRMRPLVEALPQDILSKEALAARGVEVINTDQVQLHIRESAFAEGGPFGTISSPKRKITIALLDGPFILPQLLEHDRYNKIRHLIQENHDDLDAHRKKIVQEYKQLVMSTKEEYKGIQSGARSIIWHNGTVPKDEALNSTMRMWAELKGNVYAWSFINPDTEVYAEMISEEIIKGEAAGLYSARDKDSVLFVATGDANFDSAQSTIVFYPDGSCNVINNVSANRKPSAKLVEPYNNLTPRADQTHPDPNTSFSRNEKASPEEPGSYPYGGQTAGLILRHEAAHDEFTKTNNAKKTSEFWTDERAMQGIRDAWAKWFNSGFTDDSGYSFVFQTNKAIVLT